MISRTETLPKRRFCLDTCSKPLTCKLGVKVLMLERKLFLQPIDSAKNATRM